MCVRSMDIYNDTVRALGGPGIEFMRSIVFYTRAAARKEALIALRQGVPIGEVAKDYRSAMATPELWGALDNLDQTYLEEVIPTLEEKYKDASINDLQAWQKHHRREEYRYWDLAFRR